MANAASPAAAKRTSTVSIRVGSLRIKKTYKRLPMYSKKSDQLGPFSGYISPTPRISEPGVAGIRKRLMSVATSSIDKEIFDTSHTEQP